MRIHENIQKQCLLNFKFQFQVNVFSVQSVHLPSIKSRLQLCFGSSMGVHRRKGYFFQVILFTDSHASIVFMCMFRLCHFSLFLQAPGFPGDDLTAVPYPRCDTHFKFMF